MDYLKNFNCPQFVDFNSPDLNNESTLSALEATPSGSSVKHSEEHEKMNITDESPCNLKVDFPFLGGISPSLKLDFSGSNYQENSVGISKKPENCAMNDGSSYNLKAGFSYLGYASPLSTSDINGYQENSESGASMSLQTDDFVVHHPRNLSLPENASEKNSKLMKTTKVKPFTFMERQNRKRKNEEDEQEEHIPLAEQVMAFHKKTPQRFHTGVKNFEPYEHWSPQHFIPKSPNLQASKRMRGVNVLSREELERREAEEMKKYKFHARPVNQCILRGTHLPRVGKKRPTRAQDIKLRTAERAAESHAKENLDDKPYEFHARPIPKAVLNGPTDIKPKHALPVTQAKTPNFALKSRAEKWKSSSRLNITPTEIPKFKAVPAPSVAPTAPSGVRHEKKLTQIQPFSFDSRDKQMIAHKEQKIMEEIEKENKVYRFKAQPLPSPVPSSLPCVEKKPPTIPEPFNFISEGKSSRHGSFHSTNDETFTVFKAQPAKVLEKPPFIPKKSEKVPTEVEEFQLHTDVRAVEHQKLKEINAIKEQEKELALQRLKQLQEEEEQREIARIRKEAVHKANPIRHFKPIEIKPSSIPPTDPISPKFKTDERLQLRYQV